MRGNTDSDKDANSVRYLQYNVYFPFLINEEKDFYLINGVHWIPNLTILLKNREKKNIYFVSSHIPSLVAAVYAGYCFCPIIDKNWFAIMSDY